VRYRPNIGMEALSCTKLTYEYLIMARERNTKYGTLYIFAVYTSTPASFASFSLTYALRFSGVLHSSNAK